MALVPKTESTLKLPLLWFSELYRSLSHSPSEEEPEIEDELTNRGLETTLETPALPLLVLMFVEADVGFAELSNEAELGVVTDADEAGVVKSTGTLGGCEECGFGEADCTASGIDDFLIS